MIGHQSANQPEYTVAYLTRTQSMLKEKVMAITTCVVRNFNYQLVVQWGVHCVLEMFTGEPFAIEAHPDPVPNVSVSKRSYMYRDFIFKAMRESGIEETLIPVLYGDLMNSIQEELKFVITVINTGMNNDPTIAGYSFEYEPACAMLKFQVSRYQQGIIS